MGAFLRIVDHPIPALHVGRSRRHSVNPRSHVKEPPRRAPAGRAKAGCPSCRPRPSRHFPRSTTSVPTRSQSRSGRLCLRSSPRTRRRLDDAPHARLPGHARQRSVPPGPHPERTKRQLEQLGPRGRRRLINSPRSPDAPDHEVTGVHGGHQPDPCHRVSTSWCVRLRLDPRQFCHADICVHGKGAHLQAF